MSDTHSIYKSVLGLNETGGANSSHIRTINTYVQTATTSVPSRQLLRSGTSAAPIQPIRRSSVLNRPCIFQFESLDKLFEMRVSSAFSNNSRNQNLNQFFPWLYYLTSIFQFSSVIFVSNTCNHQISNRSSQIGLFPIYVAYNIL